MTTRRTRTDLRRRAVGLLDQQLWCWGRDIARPAGNILLGLGMCRYRSAEPGPTAPHTRAASRAPASCGSGDSGCCTACRTSAACSCGERGSSRCCSTVRRSAPFTGPKISARSPARRPRAGGPRPARWCGPRPGGWMAGYEHRVAETFGTAYREATLAGRDKPPVVPAQGMARAWERLVKKAFRLTPAQATTGGTRGTLLANLRPPSDSPPSPVRPWERRATTRQQRYRTA